MAMRLALFGVLARRAWRTAIPASRAARSGSAAYLGIPSGPSSLNENGTVIRRPSNSGIATCIAASIGASAALDCSHCARELVRHSPCSTGTSNRARSPASQSLSPLTSPAAEPPAASTVVMTAAAGLSRSARPASASSSPVGRSDPQKTGNGIAPRCARAAQRVSTKAVFPASSCAR